MEKDREDIRLEQEDYFTQLHKLANNPHCSEDIRELLSEIMRAEFCTDKMDKFHQNLSAGIYDEDSQLYYRYSLVFSEDEDVDTAVERSEDILELMLLILKANYEKFETKEEE